MSDRLEIVPVRGLPEVGTGDRLGELIAASLASAGELLAAGDVVVVAQKAVSKAEGRVRALDDVVAGEQAQALAKRLGKDPRLVELILAESRAVIRAERDLLIVETLSGWICANAGIDASNVPGADRVTLLPEDSDASARRPACDPRLSSPTASGGRGASVRPMLRSVAQGWRRSTTGAAGPTARVDG